MQIIEITEKEENQRLDKFLKKYFKTATGGFLYKMLRKKNITLNKKKASGAEMLHAKDHIEVFFSDETFDKMRGIEESQSDFEQFKDVPYDIQVIHEDEDILVINKPAGVLSQKAKEDDISMNEMAISYLIHKGNLSAEDYQVFHPSIANRLDRNTSGLLLFGKSLKGQQMLSKAMKERSAEKIYHCVVKGNIDKGLHLKGYLYKNETTNQVQIQTEPFLDAKYVETSYEPLESNGDYSLLKVHLITGRTHQIRAHLASIGHPIIGDPKYGDREVNREAHVRYQLLHAYSIQLEDGRKFVAPEPAAFAKVMEMRR